MQEQKLLEAKNKLRLYQLDHDIVIAKVKSIFKYYLSQTISL